MSDMLLYMLFALIASAEGDDCRSRAVQFQPEIKGKFLENHMIRSMMSQSKKSCELQCYQEPNCVSYNYGPIDSDNPSCDLNNQSHLQAPSGDFVPKDNYIFRYILNDCESSPCPSNATCLAGFKPTGYRCVCHPGYEGDHCELVACLSSWIRFQSSCYALFTQPVTWYDARVHCQAQGAELVKIEFAEENEFIKNTYMADGLDFWIGLTDEEVEGVWKWSDGSGLSGYINWATNQPSDSIHHQNCAGIKMGVVNHVYNDAQWHDRGCSSTRGFICKK